MATLNLKPADIAGLKAVLDADIEDGYEPGFRINAVLDYYSKVDFPIVESSAGADIIKPAYRKQIKAMWVTALQRDLNDLIRLDLGEVVNTSDGLMVVAVNEGEGCYTIQLDSKVKALDYDAYEEADN